MDSKLIARVRKREEDFNMVREVMDNLESAVCHFKAVRLPGTEHMDKAYHQKRYHFIQSLWGMLIGLIPCLIGAGIYAWLF